MYITKMLYNSSVLKEVFRLDFLDGLNLSHKSSLLFSPCLKVMENKGLRVNMEKTKVMICGKGLDTIKPSGKYPCSVCRKGVGRNSIFCTSCDAWVNKKCRGIKEGLLTYQVSIVTEIQAQHALLIELGDQKLDVVKPFVYLGDRISPNGGCKVTTIARIRSTWGTFRQLLPLLTNQAISLKSKGKVYNSCIRSVMLHGSKCWALTTAEVQRLQRNERAMARWICKDHYKISSDSLLNKLCLKNLDITLRTNCLRWFGHICCSEGWIKQCTQHEVAGK